MNIKLNDMITFIFDDTPLTCEVIGLFAGNYLIRDSQYKTYTVPLSVITHINGEAIVLPSTKKPVNSSNSLTYSLIAIGLISGIAGQVSLGFTDELAFNLLAFALFWAMAGFYWIMAFCLYYRLINL